jgi:Tfp pilus assembly protein PilZ
MEPLRSKDKRAGIRIPLLSEKVSYFIDGVEHFADVSDITADGLFLKTEKLVSPRSDTLIQLALPGDLGNLQVNAKVVRVNWVANRKKGRDSLGMGVKFENISPNIRKIIDAYVVYLRNKQIITVSKRIIEEFFGNDPKKIV